MDKKIENKFKSKCNPNYNKQTYQGEDKNPWWLSLLPTNQKQVSTQSF